jgi:hypothetical protein
MTDGNSKKAGKIASNTIAAVVARRIAATGNSTIAGNSAASTTAKGAAHSNTGGATR